VSGRSFLWREERKAPLGVGAAALRVCAGVGAILVGDGVFAWRSDAGSWTSYVACPKELKDCAGAVGGEETGETPRRVGDIGAKEICWLS
jgi:hypothetical protein